MLKGTLAAEEERSDSNGQLGVIYIRKKGESVGIEGPSKREGVGSIKEPVPVRRRPKLNSNGATIPQGKPAINKHAFGWPFVVALAKMLERGDGKEKE